MTNEVAKSAGTSLSANLASKLMQGIAQSRSQTPLAGGKPYLRLLRDGEWVFGQEDLQVEDGSQWVVNVMSLQHGYSCWSNETGATKNELLGETMAPMFEAKPTRPDPIKGFPFKDQSSFDLKCISGDDTGIEVHYKASSTGGLRAIDGLLALIQAQLASNPEYPCPVIELQFDSYKHKQYGKTYVPILDLVGWSDMQGNLEGKGVPVKAIPEVAPAPAEPAPTQRRRTTAAAPAPVKEDRQEGQQAELTQAYQEPAEEAQPARSAMPRRRPGQR